MKQKKASLIFILITVFIDVLGLAIIIPIVPDLIEAYTGLGPDEGAKYGAWLMASYAILQFICAPLIGELSDRFGRRPVILLSLFGLGVDYIFHVYAPTFTWLFVGRIVGGICGASFTVANSYIADITEPDKRAQSYGLVGAVFGIGFIIGPVIGGFVGNAWGYKGAFWTAAILTLVNFVYGLFILPESLPKKKRRPIDIKRTNPFGSLKHLSNYTSVFWLIIAFFFIHLASNVMPAIWSFYTKFKFNWDAAMIGVSLTFVGLIVAIVQGGLVKVTVSKLGEFKTIYLGYILWISGMFLLSLSNQPWMLFVFVVPYCMGGVASPTLQGLISNQVSEKEQGELQGALTSLQSLSMVFALLVMPNIFDQFAGEDAVYDFPGAPFVLASIFILVSMLIAVPSLKKLFDR